MIVDNRGGTGNARAFQMYETSSTTHPQDLPVLVHRIAIPNSARMYNGV